MESEASNQAETAQALWEDDALDRRGFAEFLTNALSEQTRAVSERQSRGLTIALDAAWGAGKTFFVKHWENDLRRQGFPVVFFDAWKNDLGEEAVVALMAEIDEEMQRWFKKLPVETAAKKSAAGFMKQATQKLRRSVFPATKVLVSGLLKKGIGSSLEDLMNASDSGADAVQDDRVSKVPEAIDHALDKVFETALEEHQKRSVAIAQFVESMKNAIDLIHKEATAKIPVFVFVDELDRCRPSYAISLLEEIKHIFGIPNLCFVVSTNIAQLSESVRAVYGGGFDGAGYLKRFFDRSFTLPPPDHEPYVSILLKESEILSRRTLHHGLPLDSISEKKATVERAITYIFDVFALDLRSQRQVFNIADAAATGIEKNQPVHVIWLFFLCALLHRKEEKFSSLIGMRQNDSAFAQIYSDATVADAMIEHVEINEESFRSVGKREEISLASVVSKYYAWSFQDLKQLSQTSYTSNALEYPNSNLRVLAEELPNPHFVSKSYPPSIARYMKLVKYAGYLQTDSA